MFLKIKKFIFRFLLKFAPLLNKILPLKLKTKLKELLKVPDDKREKIPYKNNAYPEGVNLFGYLKASMGLGQGGRLYARAVTEIGAPYTLLNFSTGNIAKHNDTEFEGKFSPAPLYNTNIIHVNAEQVPMLRLSYPQESWDMRYNIYVWLWELEEFPDEWAGSFRYADEIWTPSTFTSNSIEKKSPVPVKTIPYGIYAQWDSKFDRAFFNLPTDKFLFLSMYDVNSILARKNPLGAIDAFFAAYGKNSKDQALVIKVNNPTVQDLLILKQYIKGATNVIIIDSVMTKLQVYSLIRACDVFISLHRSEGFGLVMAESMFLGRPVIATNWSANTDFMDKSNSCPVDYKFIDVGNNYYKSKPGQRWADPDIEHAADYMKKLFNDKEYYTNIASIGEEHIKTSFSKSESAKKMAARLSDIGLITL